MIMSFPAELITKAKQTLTQYFQTHSNDKNIDLASPYTAMSRWIIFIT